MLNIDYTHEQQSIEFKLVNGGFVGTTATVFINYAHTHMHMYHVATKNNHLRLLNPEWWCEHEVILK